MTISIYCANFMRHFDVSLKLATGTLFLESFIFVLEKTSFIQSYVLKKLFHTNVLLTDLSRLVAKFVGIKCERDASCPAIGR